MTFLVRTVKCDELSLTKQLQLQQEDRKNVFKNQGKGPGSDGVAPTKALRNIHACIHRSVVSSFHCASGLSEEWLIHVLTFLLM